MVHGAWFSLQSNRDPNAPETDGTTALGSSLVLVIRIIQGLIGRHVFKQGKWPRAVEDRLKGCFGCKWMILWVFTPLVTVASMENFLGFIKHPNPGCGFSDYYEAGRHASHATCNLESLETLICHDFILGRGVGSQKKLHGISISWGNFVIPYNKRKSSTKIPGSQVSDHATGLIFDARRNLRPTSSQRTRLAMRFQHFWRRKRSGSPTTILHILERLLCPIF